MTLAGFKKFLEAIKSAEVKTWEAVSDTAPTHFYNCDTSINVLDESNEILYNFSAPAGGTDPYSNQRIVVKGADLADIHEVRFGGSIEEIKKFISSYGLTLDSEQEEILIKINGANYNLKPLSGDYSSFRELSKDEIAKLSDVDKQKYEAALKHYKNSRRMKRALEVIV